MVCGITGKGPRLDGDLARLRLILAQSPYGLLTYTTFFDEIIMEDFSQVGGKVASLGEMYLSLRASLNKSIYIGFVSKS